MVIVVDIACPDCDRTKGVRKIGIDSYRCEECGCEFSHDDVLADDTA